MVVPNSVDSWEEYSDKTVAGEESADDVGTLRDLTNMNAVAGHIQSTESAAKEADLVKFTAKSIQKTSLVEKLPEMTNFAAKEGIVACFAANSTDNAAE